MNKDKAKYLARQGYRTVAPAVGRIAVGAGALAAITGAGWWIFFNLWIFDSIGAVFFFLAQWLLIIAIGACTLALFWALGDKIIKSVKKTQWKRRRK
jgi:hypothetical protein